MAPEEQETRTSRRRREPNESSRGASSRALVVLDDAVKVAATEEERRLVVTTTTRRKVLSRERQRLFARDLNGDTCLHAAVYDRNAKKLAELIAEGAEVEAANKNGDTPLLAAAQLDAYTCCRVLLDAGASTSTRNVGGFPALLAAASRDSVRCLVMLAIELKSAGGSLDAYCEGYTALHYACVNRSEECAEALLAAGIDLTLRAEPDGETALVKCARYSALGCLEAVLSADVAGATVVNVPDCGGRTALHHAALIGDADAVALLIQYGASVHVRDDSGATPMACAKSVAVVRSLAMAGALLPESYRPSVFFSGPSFWSSLFTTECGDASSASRSPAVVGPAGDLGDVVSIGAA